MTSELRPAEDVIMGIDIALREDEMTGQGYTNGDAVRVLMADREAVRAEMSDAVVTAVSTAAETVTAALEELAKFKALAEALAGTLGEAMTWNSHDDEGVPAVWLDQAAEALREYKEATQ